MDLIAFRPRPIWMLSTLFAVEGFLVSSEYVGWFGFNDDKIATAAIALVAVILSFVLMLVWSLPKAAWGVLGFFRIVARLVIRRRLQYRLRTLLVVVTLLAVPCSWLGVEMRAVKRQREAVAAIEKLNGRVVYDWEFANAQPPQSRMQDSHTLRG
jgi:hypothetical protein